MLSSSDFKTKSGAGCAIGCFLFIGVAIVLALCIPAVVIGNQGEPECATEYGGISFTFATWLRVYGIVGLVMVSILTLLTVATIFTENECLIFTLGVLGLPSKLFGVAWFVVGSILYFTTIHQTCSNQPIGQFGLAWFIISVIGFAWELLSKKSSSS